MRVGDRIESIDDVELATPKAISNLLARSEPGAKVKVKVKRGKRSRHFRVELCDAAVQAGLGE